MKSTPIIFITLNSIKKYLSHASQMHIHTYKHIDKEFKIQSCIQAYKGDTNVYGPLWTLTCRCAVWTFFLIILYLFFSYSFLKRLYHPPYYRQSYDRLSPSSQHHVWLHPSYILLFSQHSPVICKDFFPLIHMYKSSRYYAVFNIDLGPMFPQSTSLLKSWNWLHCSLQAFGLYCQRLPGLTTKSIHCYL